MNNRLQDENMSNEFEYVMPDLQFSVLCDEVRQEINGNFQFLGVFADGIRVKQLPVRGVRLFVVNRWANGLGSFKQHTTIYMPDEKTPLVKGRDVDVKLESTGSVHTCIEAFVNLEIREAGKYWVEIEMDGHLRSRYAFNVACINKQAPAST